MYRDKFPIKDMLREGGPVKSYSYWANDLCLQDMTFDLGDPVCWEVMLMGSSKPLLLIPDMEEEDIEEEENDNQVSQKLG